MFHRCDDHGEKLSLTRRTFNITQKISICKFNYTKNIYLFCYCGMLSADGGGRGGLMCRWHAGGGGVARVIDVQMGYAGFLMATVVCGRRGCGACV